MQLLTKNAMLLPAVPSPPTGPLEIRMMGNIVTTAWGTPEWDGGAPLLGYHIAIRDVTKTMWMEVGKVDVHSLKFNIKDLSENHTYMIRIYASNEIGLSEPLESVEPFKVIPCGGESECGGRGGGAIIPFPRSKKARLCIQREAAQAVIET